MSELKQNTYTRLFGGDASVFGRVAVLFGGLSAEREVSLQSGSAVIEGLKKAGVDVVELDINKNAVHQIQDAKVDRVFNILHGGAGEDGKIQAVLDWLEIPYTGSGHAASALAMDKLKTKQVWQSVGLPTPDYRTLNSNSDWGKVMAELGGQAFIKPIHEGSSIGMTCVSNAAELESAYQSAIKYDSQVIAESRVIGNEYTVSILNGCALPAIQMRTKNVFYDYQAKYLSDETEYFCPCGLNEEKENELRHIAINAFNEVGCSGWGRVDFMQDEASGNFYLLEVNTAPGMTSHSLVPMAAKVAGLSFQDLVVEILMGTL